jgi:hypothetical protein
VDVRHVVRQFDTGVAVADRIGDELGAGLLRRSWFNLDLIWAGALMLTGALTLLL